jgi:hypothetical protein
LDELQARNSLHIRDENGREIETVWALWRETENQELLFLTNTSGARVTANVEIRADVASWQTWSLESGERAPLGAAIEAGTSQFAVELAPYDSRLLIGSREEIAVTAVAEARIETRVLSLDGQWQLRLDRPNALRLNRWRAHSSNADWSAFDVDEANWREIEALPLRHLDQRGNAGWVEPLERGAGEAVWYRRKHRMRVRARRFGNFD